MAKSGIARLLALLLALGVTVTACGDDDGGAAAGDDDCVMRFTFAPDPAWDWIVDQGILEQMEEESGCRIVQSLTWDEFGLFAGGHADVVSVGSYETPVLEAETGAETVTFAKFNLARDIVLVPGDEPWETLADLPSGCKVGVEAFVGSTTVWAALAADQHGRELGEGSDDLQMALADFSVIPDLILQGDVCAGVSGAATATAELLAGTLKPLYGGRGASQLYADYYAPGHRGMSSNNFIALKSWYDDNPEEIAFFMKVWEVALAEYKANLEEIVRTYPEHFAVEGEDQVAFILDWYTNQFDHFVEDPYLTEEWIQAESGVFDILKRAELIPADQEHPIYVCIDPTSGEETCRYP